MGMFKKNCLTAPSNISASAPNPEKFEILENESMQIGKYTIVTIVYPNCTNYEGKKILVYNTTSLDNILKRKTIDPHFEPNKLSPNSNPAIKKSFVWAVS